MNKTLLVFGGLMCFFLVIGYFGGNSAGEIHKVESDQLRKERDEEKSKREVVEKNNTELRAENEKLRADLEGGRGIAEERLGLDKRSKEVDRREKSIAAREDQVVQMEADLSKKREEFFQRFKTNEQEYGRALHALQQYDGMKADLNSERSSRNTWLIAFFMVLVVGFATLAWLFIVIQRRQHALTLIGTLTHSTLSPEQTRQAIAQVLNAEDTRQHALPLLEKT